MKFWIVGGYGMVGSDLDKVFTEKKLNFFRTSSQEGNVLDPAQLEKCFDEHRPDHIFNCSANVNVDKMEEEEYDIGFRVNRDGVANLAELAKRKGVRLIHVSTDYVFDGDKETDYSEEEPTNAIQAYGKSKLAGEEALLSIYPEALSVRTANLYGRFSDGLVTGMVKALQEKEQCQHITDQTSSPTNTEDLSRALFDVRECSGILHFVNGGHASRFEMMQEVKRLMEKYNLPIKCKSLSPISKKDLNRSAMRPTRSVLCTDKIKPFLTFEIRSWKEALDAYIRGKYEIS